MFMFRRSTTGWMMALALAFVLACPVNLEADDRLDVSYIPPDSVLGAVIYPRRILHSPAVQMHPAIGGITKELQGILGFDPNDVDQLWVIIGPIEGNASTEVGFVFHLTRPHDPRSVLPAVRKQTKPGTVNGKTYQRATASGGNSLYAAGDRTLLVAPDDLLRKMLANRRGPTLTTVSGVLHRYDDLNDMLAIVLIKPLRPMIATRLPADAPPEMAELVKLPELVKTFGIKTTLSGTPSLTLGARCKDNSAAAEAKRILNSALKTLKKDSSARFFFQQDNVDPRQAIMAAEMHKQFVKFANMLRLKRKGDRLEVSLRANKVTALQAELASLLPFLLSNQ